MTTKLTARQGAIVSAYTGIMAVTITDRRGQHKARDCAITMLTMMVPVAVMLCYVAACVILSI